MGYVSFDLWGEGLKVTKPPNNVYTYGHKNYWTSRRKDKCNADKEDNSPHKKIVASSIDQNIEITDQKVI